MIVNMPDWVEEFPGAITVSAKDGRILYMNAKASASFAKQGGREALVGGNLMDCHGEASKAILRALTAERRSNAYTTTKEGVRRFIFQSPWYESGELAGLVEIAMEIPADLPHFDRG